MRKFCTLASALAALSCFALTPGCHGQGTPHYSLGPSSMARLFHGGDHAEHDGQHLDQVADALELSTAQRKAVAGVLTGHLPGLRTRADTLMRAFNDQVVQVHDAHYDEVAIRVAAQAVGAAQAELAVGIAALLHDVHGELTPAQLDKARHMHTPEFGARATKHMDEIGRAVAAWAERQ